jgi:Uma2 family endonuclease
MSIVSENLMIGPGVAGTLMTPEEFDAAQDWEEGYVYELINEVLVVTPPAGIEERAPNDLLGQLLRNYRERHPLGKSLDYTVSEHTVRTGKNRRRADRVIWAGLGRLPDVDRDPPTIAIEFLSPGRRARKRDYDAKRKEYEKAGVIEYWIIDRFRKSFTVFRRKGRKSTELVFGANDVYTTPLLPGFELPLARLFAEAELFGDHRGEDD